MAWWWTTQPDGVGDGPSERFGSKDEAEAWLGGAWASLRDSGCTGVTLVEDGRVEYEMSLADPD